MDRHSLRSLQMPKAGIFCRDRFYRNRYTQMKYRTTAERLFLISGGCSRHPGQFDLTRLLTFMSIIFSKR
jgi:hypothetical protein